MLLIVLWVRSYYYAELMSAPFIEHSRVNLWSHVGVLGFEWNRDSWEQPYIAKLLAPLGLSVDAFRRPWVIERLPNFRIDNSWSLEYTSDELVAGVPHWFLLTVIATIAVLPWIKWRFSLRTLLIMMTLFALFFGAIAMSM